ncbi:SDR family NAD(P)-dependent oxidoreductase [Pseudozobellia sp. WGM2]|uniref:SDR family NAD(P)-dependent oxidoreductase n=1 Tax=Pseudozobellia sp. WGM2 TaxID=2787625 RepID=UPI001AE0A9AA|nr:SDR family oxidoreductase [Pseudozobellia sp. WGM2]
MKKNILVIGGSQGIGFSLINLLKNDYNLFVVSRTVQQLSTDDITHIQFDVLNEDLETELLPESLDGFVYCPGSINLKPFKMMSLDTIEKDMQINFFAMVRLLKGVFSKLSNGSSLVFFSTVAVVSGMPYHTSVAAAKGALEGFVKSFAAEHAPKIRANVIAPSLVDTPLSSRLLSSDKKRAQVAERHPLKKIGSPNDIAAMAKFLLGEESKWITGQVIGVDGGLSTLNIN